MYSISHVVYMISLEIYYFISFLCLHSMCRLKLTPLCLNHLIYCLCTLFLLVQEIIKKIA